MKTANDLRVILAAVGTLVICYRDITRMLAHQLADYGQRYKDPRITNARIQSQIAALTE